MRTRAPAESGNATHFYHKRRRAPQRRFQARPGGCRNAAISRLPPGRFPKNGAGLGADSRGEKAEDARKFPAQTGGRARGNYKIAAFRRSPRRKFLRKKTPRRSTARGGVFLKPENALLRQRADLYISKFRGGRTVQTLQADFSFGGDFRLLVLGQPRWNFNPVGALLVVRPLGEVNF